MFQARQHTVGVGTGWAWVQSDVLLEPDGSGDGPVDNADQANLEWDTTYTASARYEYFLTDNWLLGTRIDWRGYHSKSFQLADRNIALHDHGTMHFVESLRYLFDPIGDTVRWRPFAGGELSYVPGVNFRADVTGPAGDSGSEQIRYRGNGFYNLGVSTGLSYLWADDTLLEFGALYEFPLGSSEDRVEFGDPEDLQDSRTKWDIEPEGLFFFVSLMVSY
ncbi:MAG: hypothetical protein ACI841_004967 [Planctomycetota bacterium]|jgi:hypothetical protein